MKGNHWKTTAMVLAILAMGTAVVLAATPGDVNDDGKVETADAVMALRATAGLLAGVDADLTDAVTALRVMAGIFTGFTNTLGMTFNLIPAGTFTMGSPTTEPGRYSGEIQHPVTLTQNFHLMTTEVTQAQWQAVMGANPSNFSACGGNCPVETVSWDDVQTFITTLNAREGKTYRLPTEAEWEYAARAGTTTAFYNGAITNTGHTPLDPNLDLIGWYSGNSTVTYTPNSSGKGAHPVAEKQPNAFGLYDMSGNVWEWCQDWYGTYPSVAVTDPSGSATGSNRVIRGGSWFGTAGGCRSAARGGDYPSYRGANGGFRLALSPQ